MCTYLAGPSQLGSFDDDDSDVHKTMPFSFCIHLGCLLCQWLSSCPMLASCLSGLAMRVALLLMSHPQRIMPNEPCKHSRLHHWSLVSATNAHYVRCATPICVLASFGCLCLYLFHALQSGKKHAAAWLCSQTINMQQERASMMKSSAVKAGLTC